MVIFMFLFFMCIIYIICLIIELSILKKDKINIFDTENLLPALFIPLTVPLAIYTLFWSLNLIFEDFFSLNNSENGFFCGYYFPLVFGSLTYMFYYVKRIIYAFLADEDKLKLYRNKHIFYTQK